MSTPLNLNQGGVVRRRFLKGSDLGLVPSSTPPTNPAAGDLWLYPISTGGIWQFVYDTTETSAYKWKFIGGPAWVSVTSTAQNPASGTWTDLNTATFTARAGDYIFTGSCFGAFTTTSSSTVELGIGKNGSSVAGIIGQSFPVTTAFDWHLSFSNYEIDGFNQGDVISLQGWQNSGGANYQFSIKSFSIIPKRIA